MKSLALLIFAGCVVAADLPVSGPVLGYVLDGSIHRVRPVLGIPGAAVMGHPLDVGADVYQAVFSPGGNYVLALAGDSRAPMLIVPNRPAAAITGAQAAPDQMALSPQGTAAALYFQSAATVEILTGLPGAAAVARTVDVSGVPSAPVAIAVSDDGNALVAVVGGDAPALYAFASDGTMSRVALSETVAAVAFLNRAQDVVLGGVSDAFLLQDVLGAQTLTALVSDGLQSPVALAVAADNTRAFALNSNLSGVVTLDLGGGPAALADCGCTATGLAQMNGNATFRLTDYTGDPMLVFDAGVSNTRVLFVPPAV
ncbi:MAG: hypothetical protein ABI165_16525, partial [Bryobacteraceae bacterium]